MGYAVYEIDHRWCGYGVPAFCEHPECNEEIDRGLYYVCGGEPGGSEFGCGLYFCGDHLYYKVFNDDEDDPVQLCDRCYDGEPPFEMKPDHPDWVKHMLTDESWQEWRDENTGQVEHMRSEYGIA